MTESTERSLRFSSQQMVFQICWTIEDSKLTQTTENMISENWKKTGHEMDEVLKTTVLHVAMNAKSGGEVCRSRIDLKFDQTNGFVEELYHEEQNRDCTKKAT